MSGIVFDPFNNAQIVGSALISNSTTPMNSTPPTHAIPLMQL